jgi:hypothetical protein
MEIVKQLWAVIEGNTVINTVLWDGESKWSQPEGAMLVSLSDRPHVGIGWEYVNGEFVDNRPQPDGEP